MKGKKSRKQRCFEEEVVKKDLERNSNLFDISNDIEFALREYGVVNSRDPECVRSLKNWINADQSVLTRDRQQAMIDVCFDIHENVMAGCHGNLEIELDHRVQYSEDGEIPLENTAIVATPMSIESPSVVLISVPGAPANIRLYAATDIQRNAAFMVYQDPDNGKEIAIPLVTVKMLSIGQDNQPEKEFGLMTSYLFWTGKLYSSELMARDISVIKQVFWEDLLREVWKQEPKARLTLKEEVGDKNE